MLKKLPALSGVLIILLSCTQNTISEPVPPLVDGSIKEYSALGVEPISLMDDVNLYIYQNQHYVWIAFDYPENSFGTMDLKMVTPNVADTINLHVSAQLGEWFTKKGSPKPETSTSELWWNMNGWYANEVWVNGMDRSGETPQYNFKNASAREMQISKARFGKGIWNFKLDIRAIKLPDGTMGSTSFPKNDNFHSLKVN